MKYNPLDFYKIAGDDKHNAEVDRRIEQIRQNNQHSESIQIQRKSNELSEKALKNSEKANTLSIIAIIVSAVLSITSIFIAIFT